MGIISSLKKAFSKPYETVSVADATELLASGAALINVRSTQEWRSGRAPQTKHVPCRMFAPTYGAAAERHPDITFAKVDTEAEQALAAAASITFIPTLTAFKDKTLVFSPVRSAQRHRTGRGHSRRKEPEHG